MLSLTAHTQIPSSNHRTSRLSSHLIPTLIPARESTKLGGKWRKFLHLGFGLTEERRVLKLGRSLDSCWRCGGRKGGGDLDLEAEIMDFMANSEKPTMFPTKEELVRAGRLDLVKAIKKKGGWFSLGWDVENVGDDVVETMDSDIAEFHRRIESCKLSGSSSFPEDFESFSSRNSDSLQPADSYYLGPSSFDSSQQVAGDEGSGTDGILSRLKKQRNSDFLAIKLAKKGNESQSKSEDVGDDRQNDTSGFGGSGLEENSKLMDSSGANDRHYTEPDTWPEPDTWRSWIHRRAELQVREFEAGEISFERTAVHTNKESYHDGVTVTSKEYAEDLGGHEEINLSEIRTRLKRLESELTTALQSVRSKGEDSISEEATGSSGELQDLSDALEFQENEVMRSKQKLRSLRAKLAVVEGKMTLALIDAQKTVRVKQKQLNDTRKPLQQLRITSIIWANSAAEVLLAGSFDGWTTQRRMHRSKSGVFSITLRLYPGRYEIKFIVDGQWRVDPLRPTVNNNGHENNLFTVT